MCTTKLTPHASCSKTTGGSPGGGADRAMDVLAYVFPGSGSPSPDGKGGGSLWRLGRRWPCAESGDRTQPYGFSAKANAHRDVRHRSVIATIAGCRARQQADLFGPTPGGRPSAERWSPSSCWSRPAAAADRRRRTIRCRAPTTPPARATTPPPGPTRATRRATGPGGQPAATGPRLGPGRDDRLRGRRALRAGLGALLAADGSPLSTQRTVLSSADLAMVNLSDRHHPGTAVTKDFTFAPRPRSTPPRRRDRCRDGGQQPRPRLRPGRHGRHPRGREGGEFPIVGMGRPGRGLRPWKTG